MEEEKKEIEEVEEQPLEDNSKVQFPTAGIIIIGVLAVLMIACIIIISVLGNK